MFELDKLENVITFSVKEKMETMVKEIRESLSTPAYNKIIKNFSIKIEGDSLKFFIELPAKFKAENQDTLRVLTYGGVFEKENKEFVTVPPNITLMRYFP